MTGEMVSGDLVNLAERIREEHQACLQSLRKGVEHALKVGELLVQAKELVKHGDWGDWVETNCDFTPRMACYYMEAFRNVQRGLVKTETISEMTLKDVLFQADVEGRVGERREPSRKTLKRAKVEAAEEMIELCNRLETLVAEAVQSEKTALGDYTLAMVMVKINKVYETLGNYLGIGDEIRQELDRLDAVFQNLLEGGEQ